LLLQLEKSSIIKSINFFFQNRVNIDSAKNLLYRQY